nr:MAG TPA: putative tail component [Caudoviricetes sp.]
MESVEFAGYDRILYKLTSLYDLKGVENGIEKGCVLVERDAKKKAPKDTGTLRRSITSEVKAGNTDVEGSVFTPLEYAPYVEYGTGLFAEQSGRSKPWSYQDEEGNWHTTKGQHPQPFLRPALNENKEKILELIKEGLLND